MAKMSKILKPPLQVCCCPKFFPIYRDSVGARSGRESPFNAECAEVAPRAQRKSCFWQHHIIHLSKPNRFTPIGLQTRQTKANALPEIPAYSYIASGNRR